MAKKTLPVKNDFNVKMESEVERAPSTMQKKDEEMERRRYRAEDAIRDLERAECHKKDKQLMKDIKSLAKEKMKVLGKI